MLRVGPGCGLDNATTTGLSNVSASGQVIVAVFTSGFFGFALSLVRPSFVTNCATVLVLLCSWMCDFGEYVAFDAVLGETGAPLSPAQAHNLFPQLWAQTVREAVDEVQQQQHSRQPVSGGVANDVVFFSRSSAGRSPSFSPLFWMGAFVATAAC